MFHPVRFTTQVKVALFVGLSSILLPIMVYSGHADSSRAPAVKTQPSPAPNESPAPSSGGSEFQLEEVVTSVA